MPLSCSVSSIGASAGDSEHGGQKGGQASAVSLSDPRSPDVVQKRRFTCATKRSREPMGHPYRVRDEHPSSDTSPHCDCIGSELAPSFLGLIGTKSANMQGHVNPPAILCEGTARYAPVILAIDGAIPRDLRGITVNCQTRYLMLRMPSISYDVQIDQSSSAGGASLAFSLFSTSPRCCLLLWSSFCRIPPSENTC